MAQLSAVHRPPPAVRLFPSSPCRNPKPNFMSYTFFSPRPLHRGQLASTSSHLCEQEEPLDLDASSLVVQEARSDGELRAAVGLRLRSFYEFNRWHANEDYKRYLMKREFEGLKDRIEGKKKGFRRASCINATLSLSPYLVSADGLCSSCKFFENGEDRVVVGTLDLNQCLRLAGELAGTKPEDVGGNISRGYLTNVCVTTELQRNGLGYALVAKSKEVARVWGITDLYAHVAVDNEAALKLYQKCGFLYEDEEPAWEAKFLDRPRRYLLWADVTDQVIK